MNDKWLTINFERYGRDKKDRGGMGRCRHSGDNRSIRSAERAERRDYYIAGTDCCLGLQSEPLCVGEYQIVPGDTCQTGTGDRYQACV